MNKTLYMIYIIVLVIGCFGVVASIIMAIYIYIKEDLNEYINFEFLSKFNIKKKFEKRKKQCLEEKSSLLAVNDQEPDDTTLLNDDTTLLNDDKN